MKIAIGADHGGFTLKGELSRFLDKIGYELIDVGCYSEESIDYPDVAVELSKKIFDGECTRGILICGTGIGMSIAVNRDRRIRAALCHDEYTARMSREHNDANVLCLGARVIGAGVAESLVATWLETEFSGGRHQRRISKMSD